MATVGPPSTINCRTPSAPNESSKSSRLPLHTSHGCTLAVADTEPLRDNTMRRGDPPSTWRTTLGGKFLSRLEKLMGVFESRPLKIEGYCHQLIFPNLTVASTQGTSFSVQFFEPVDADTTRFTSVVFQTALARELPDSSKSTVDALNESVKAFNRAVFSEDKEICEQVQQGARVTNQAGVLSDEELRVYDFQKQYASRMNP